MACALILMVRGQAKKEVTLGKLHEAYAKLCQQRHLKFESESEFVGLCNMLATSGIIDMHTQMFTLQTFLNEHVQVV